MSKFKPTKEQELAINENENMLVSAAAGSGKTAILVERVIRLICDTENPIPADRLLIVTFTNAAAAELKLRIEKRFNEVISQQPFNVNLQRQKILLSNARICTIDSFCLDFIRENFEKAGVDPSFKIASNSDVKMLSAAAMSELMNDEFNSGNEEFLSLLEYVGAIYDDKQLSEIIQNIYEFSRQMPYPNEWLYNICKSYKDNANKSSDEWIREVFCLAKKNIYDAIKFSDSSVSLIQSTAEAWEKYKDNLLYINEYLSGLSAEENWDILYEKLCGFNPPKLKPLSAAHKTADVLQGMKDRDEAIEIIKKIKTTVYASESDLLKEIAFSVKYISKISELVMCYEKKLYEMFAERGLVTFYMAEQIALSLISEYKDGNVLPSSDAVEFVSAYDAVLVDEYQDTNDLQDCLFNIISNNQKNLFCVGDAKQSIYRFRGANPYNFISKKKLYKPKNIEDRFGLRIDLTGNFRSRAEICDYINRVFGLIMHEENAEIEYDNNEELKSLATFPKSEDVKTEYHFIDMKAINESGFFEDIKESSNKIIAEANVIAKIIEDTVSAKPFLKEGDGLRKAQYGDIAILLRSPAKTAEIIAGTLNSLQIPVSLPVSNIFDTDEVTTITSLLKIINNPFDDIALLTVMTSPLYMFTIDELAEMRANSRNGKFISAVSVAAKDNKKAENFLKALSNFRETNAVSKVFELLEEIYETTNYTGIVSRLTDGKQKRNNLFALLNLAHEFEKEERRGLREFLKSLENISNGDIKAFELEKENSVKIMSIHSSKGLQFPICILADTDRKFNFSDSNASLLIDEHYGFSFKYYDSQKKEKSNTIIRTLMSQYQRNKLVSEEVRLLYVALTRAEEKLIVTSCVSDLRKRISEITDFKFLNGGKIDTYYFSKTDSYSDWLLADAFLNDTDSYLEYLNGRRHPLIHTKLTPQKSKQLDRAEPDSETARSIQEHYSFEYPYSDLLNIEAKASVTDIVHKADEDQYSFIESPAFMRGERLSGAEKGTATHKFMQYCNYNNAEDSIEDECERLYEFGYLTDDEKNAVNLKAVAAFFTSTLYQRIKKSAYVKREMNFLTEFEIQRLKPEIRLDLCNEKIIVQGSVDLLFEENGKLIIVDFKTDRNKNENELISVYGEQLRIYKEACEILLLKPVTETLLYSFSLGKEISV